MRTESMSFLFLGAMIVLGLALGGASFFSRDVDLKRKLHVPGNVGVGLMFLGFIGTGLPTAILLIAIPMVAFIVLFNIRTTRFCDACGATLIKQTLVPQPTRCGKCGSQLER